MSSPDPIVPATAPEPGAAGTAAPGSAPAGAAQRLPTDPYPGIRPFLPHEATLLFGRERQVGEVIDRLRESQFVAVLGGSGSGKSSLVMAGVLPALRSFGIAEAGDFWLTLTTTPGSNVGAEDSAARRHSPVTRLARRFAGLLQPLPSREEEAERQQQIAETFRMQGGFGRLLERFGPQLAVRAGQDPRHARVLFVLDQFEEIFHPTNQGVEDARLLVERVLDQFFAAHERVFVVLTMRSEHLNDCAAYLELPDAINKSSYLIRRLDESELREAITEPAQRYLRLRRREAARTASFDGDDAAPPAGSARRLPARVVFEPEVIDRVLEDTCEITHDPDHLPLLQHLLARVWDAALAREAHAAGLAEHPSKVPAEVRRADLALAVHPESEPAQAEAALAASANVLRDCVENWPGRLYRAMSTAEREAFDAMLGQLAFKDPNTGMYSQQRLDIVAALPHLGGAARRPDGQPVAPAELKARLVHAGFLRSVDYLFWDDEDPSRITLKVSHESFIRGWTHFRRLIDQAAERYDEYIDVLRRCAAWHASGRSEGQLLRDDDLQRLALSHFAERAREPRQQAAWAALLKLDRDGTRLAGQPAQLADFLAASNQRQFAEADRRKRDKRKKQVLAWTLLGVVPLVIYSQFIQTPVLKRIAQMLDAGQVVNRTPLSPEQQGITGAARPLEELLAAAERFELARSGRNDWRGPVSEWLLDGLAWFPPVASQRQLLKSVESQTEPRFNGVLRGLLVGSVWPGAAAPAGVGGPYLTAPEAYDRSCVPALEGKGSAGTVLSGRLYVADSRREQKVWRALFVPEFDPDEAGATLDVRAASYEPAEGRCRFEDPPLFNVPLAMRPHVLIDSGLRYIAYGIDGVAAPSPAITLFELEWERNASGGRRVVTSRERNVIFGLEPAQRLAQVVGPAQVAVASSWRTDGGRTAGLQGTHWRVLVAGAQRLPRGEDEQAFLPVRPAVEGSRCAALLEVVVQAAPADRRAFELGSHCLVLWFDERLAPVPASAPAAVAEAASAADSAGPERADTRRRVSIALYEQPGSADPAVIAAREPAAVASIADFAQVDPAAAEWRVGSGPRFEGWLGVVAPNSSGTMRLLAAPLSNCALVRLGRQVQADGRLEAPSAGSPRQGCPRP